MNLNVVIKYQGGLLGKWIKLKVREFLLPISSASKDHGKMVCPTQES
jgi:hypothetical protein